MVDPLLSAFNDRDPGAVDRFVRCPVRRSNPKRALSRGRSQTRRPPASRFRARA